MPVSSLPRRASVRGVALVIVLWMLALLSVIAGSLAFSTRTDLSIAGNLASAAQAEAAADAGIHKAIYELLTAPAADMQRWQGNGQPHAWQFGQARLTIRIVDEAAKIDLNTAGEALLRGLLTSQGLPEAEADALVDAILDWRDPDSLRRLHGAERDDYAGAGRSGPANMNFEAVEELRQVMGVSRELYSRLEPLVTVHSQQAGVNSTIASREVLLAIPGATLETVDAYLQQRKSALAAGQAAPVFPVGPGVATARGGAALTIQVTAILGDNVRFNREAVVRLAPSGMDPFTILAWRTPLTSFPADVSEAGTSSQPTT